MQSQPAETFENQSPSSGAPPVATGSCPQGSQRSPFAPGAAEHYPRLDDVFRPPMETEECVAVRYWAMDLQNPGGFHRPIGVFLTKPLHLASVDGHSKGVEGIPPLKSFFMVKEENHAYWDVYESTPVVRLLSRLVVSDPSAWVPYSYQMQDVIVEFSNCSSYSEALRRIGIIPALVDP